MSSKRNSVGGWPGPRRVSSVRDKLSGFVQRGRGLAKKTTLSMIGESRERPALDDAQKAFPRVQVQDFGTSRLDIDLQSLEAFRIAPETEKKKEQPKWKPEPKSSTTPIADMFSKRTAFVEPTAPVNPSCNKSSGSVISCNPRKAQAEDTRQENARTPQDPSEVLTVRVVKSDHGQPHSSIPWPPPEKPHSVASTHTAALDLTQPGKVQNFDSRRAAFVPSSRPTPIITSGPTSRPRQNGSVVAEQPSPVKRHSTPISLQFSTAPANPQPAGSIQTDRRRSWQPSPSPYQAPSASTPYRNTLPNRQGSSRLPANRLAWIKELEEGRKDRPTINSDLPVLKTIKGSVADKLAKFESKQTQAYMGPVTRSNSTRSRTSSVADTTFSSHGGMATTRSSLDSHRTSSVFSHYDDSFREKMEKIAAGSKAEGAEEKPVLTKVTASFICVVSAEKCNKQACVDKPEQV